MLTRILSTIFAVAAAGLLVTLALANRHYVNLVLDPFNPANPALSVGIPFYFFLIGALTLGVIIGGLSVWMSQGKWRRIARQRTQEAMRWKGEVERLTRERDAHVAAAKQLASATPSRSTASSPATMPLVIAGR
ncbi:MAG: LapA family protein [Hyphomicrobiaceae bacterium]